MTKELEHVAFGHEGNKLLEKQMKLFKKEEEKKEKNLIEVLSLKFEVYQIGLLK